MAFTTHNLTLETGVLQKVNRRHEVTWTDRFRVNCSCGFHTEWCAIDGRAWRQANSHAVNGQATLDV